MRQKIEADTTCGGDGVGRPHYMTQDPGSDGRLDPTERKFLDAIRHHLAGWKRKIDGDFGKESCDEEIANLAGDPVYAKFAFGCPKYVLVP